MAACAALLLTAGVGVAGAAAADRKLRLEVILNGRPTKLVGAFLQREDGQFLATREELKELGIEPPGAGPADEWLPLASIPDLAYVFDDQGQRMTFTAGDRRLVPHRVDLRGTVDDAPTPSGGYGAVLNYGVSAAGATGFEGWRPTFTGASTHLEGRIFSPFGYLTQTAIVGTTIAQPFDALRLDTTFAYSDPQSATSYRAGDVITRGPAWARSIRLGGVQAERNFGLRSDLVTAPLPSVSGSAAVPSTVDVFVDNVRTFSREIPAGPYEITSLPVITGNGSARVVVRDASGREQETSLPFLATSRLLRGGLFDFAAEAGAPRRSYAVSSFDYDKRIVGIGSARYGAADWLTVEGHAEGGAGLVNAGAGLAANLGAVGVVSLAGRTSWFRETLGYQAHAGFETVFGGLALSLATSRSFGQFEDLASVTAPGVPETPKARMGRSPDLVSGDVMMAGMTMRSSRPARALDRAAVGIPIPAIGGSFGIGYVSLQPDGGARSRIVTASYSQNLWQASLSASVFADLDRRENIGAFVGLSMPLGFQNASVGAGASLEKGGAHATLEASRPLGLEPGSYGWRARMAQGAQQGLRSADASYRGSAGRVEASVDQTGNGVRGTLQADGAVAATPDGVFLADRIDDAFAVVNVGAPDVEVFHQNRSAGRTGRSGSLLVPGLIANQPNQITIDPTHLPPEAHLTTTQETIVPAERSGVSVPFGVETKARSAVLILKDKTGSFLRPGLQGRVEGTNETFVVGYDGKAYLLNLSPTNAIRIENGTDGCTATFDYTPAEGGQTVIGPLVCQ